MHHSLIHNHQSITLITNDQNVLILLLKTVLVKRKQEIMKNPENNLK